jgi:hypothetical protein
MKKLILILSIVFIAGAVFTQEIESHKPMGRWSYNFLTKRMEKPKRDEKRMKKGVRIIKRKDISSNQVYKLSMLFTEDEYRLGFVKGAYPSISDKSNSIVICDAFEKYSHQTILWEYIQKENARYGIDPTDIASFQDYLEMRDRKKDKQYDKDKDKNKDLDIDNNNEKDIVKNNDNINNDMTEKDTETSENNKDLDTETDVTREIVNNDTEIISEVKIIFPDALNYSGTNKGCDGFLNNKQFTAFANSVAQFEDDEEKATICMEYVYTYCFTTEQVMKLGIIIKDEPYRYVFFKTAYEKVYDKDNFLHVKQLLTNDKFINGINEIYEVPSREKPRPIRIDKVEEKCTLSDNDFASIKSEIRKESFSTTRLEVAKVLIKTHNCISSTQVKDLLSLFSLEADKVDFAKFTYEYTIDQKNYTIVRDYFTSQASKDTILKIMSGE